MSSNRWRLKVGCMTVALAALLSGLIGSVTPVANAAGSGYPMGCTRFKGTDGRAYAECTSGSVYFQVAFSCRYAVGWPFEVGGKWVYPRAGNRSVASCPWGAWSDTPYPWINV